jgi:predicted dehydrogenase
MAVSTAPTVAGIGAGGVAQVHVPAWQELGVRLRVYSVEYSPGIRSRLDPEIIVESLEEALDGADVVDVCTPSHTHADVIRAAAAAGCHVICEKPLALDVATAAEMIAVCDQAGVKLYPAHVVRFFPEYAAMHAHVTAGGVGDIAVQRFTRSGSRPAAAWFADSALSGGIVMDQMIHDLDLARWTAGEVRQVFARSTTAGSVVSAQVVLTHDTGALSYVSGTWAPPGSVFRTRFEVAGSDGLVHHDSNQHAPLVIDGGVDTEGRGLLPPRTFTESPYAIELREFLGAITGGPEPRVSAADGLEAVRLAEAANTSLRTGTAVDVSTITERTFA